MQFIIKIKIIEYLRKNIIENKIKDCTLFEKKNVIVNKLEILNILELKVKVNKNWWGRDIDRKKLKKKKFGG